MIEELSQNHKNELLLRRDNYFIGFSPTQNPGSFVLGFFIPPLKLHLPRSESSDTTPSIPVPLYKQALHLRSVILVLFAQS